MESVDRARQYGAGCGACGRVWGHVAGSEEVLGGQAYSIDRDMLEGWDGVGACGRVWGNVAGVMAGCGGMWQGLGYVPIYAIDLTPGNMSPLLPHAPTPCHHTLPHAPNPITCSHPCHRPDPEINFDVTYDGH